MLRRAFGLGIVAIAALATGCGGGGSSSSPSAPLLSIATQSPTPLPTASASAAPLSTTTPSFTSFSLPAQPGATLVSSDDRAYFVSGQALIAVASDGTRQAFAANTNGSTQLTQTSDGAVWYNSSNPGAVYRLDPATTKITQYPILGAGSNVGTYAIASTSNDTVWAGVLGSQSLGFLRVAAGSAQYFPAPNIPQVTINAMARGSDGNVWFTGSNPGDSSQPYIGRINADGTTQIFPMPAAKAQVYAMTAGSDGNLWYCDSYNARIGYITPAGVYSTQSPIGTQPFLCYGIARSKQPGSYWFLNSYVGSLNLWNGSSVSATYALPDAATGPNPIGLGADSKGNLWTGEGNKTLIDYIRIP